jgi:multidrug resistance protein, MATE family
MFLGLATVIVSDRRFRRYRLFGRFWRADWPRLRQLWRLGLPIGFIMIFEVVLFTGSTAVMGYINQASLAAHAIALQIASVAFMAPLGFGQAATVRIGRAYGAGDSEGIRLAGLTAFFMVMAFMSATAMLMVLFPTQLIGIFIDITKPENAAVLKLGIVFLFFAAMFQLFDGAQAVLLGMLRGLHDTKMPMVFAALSYWCVGMPVGIWLAFKAGWEGAGVWMGLLAGLAAVSALLGVRWLRRGRLGLETVKT